MTILESVVQQGSILESNVVELTVLQSDVVYAIGKQGATGPQGPAGGSAVTYPAGETIAPARVVIIEGGEAFHFQPSDVTHQGRAYGISTASAAIGADTTIQIGGEIEHASFSFSADRMLYVFNNGIIVDTVPSLALTQLAGISSENNKMRIDFSISIKKS